MVHDGIEVLGVTSSVGHRVSMETKIHHIIVGHRVAMENQMTRHGVVTAIWWDLIASDVAFLWQHEKN